MAIEKDNAELDKYINDLADIQEPTEKSQDNNTADGGDDADNNEEQQQSTNQQNDDANQQAEGSDKSEKGQQPKDNSKKGEQPGKSKKGAEQDQLRPLGDGTFANTKGDIVDQSGKLIAQNGFAARMYHSNRRLKATLDERTQQLTQLSQSVGEVQSLSRSIQQYGLDNNEVAQAMDMAGRMKRGDVLSVAKDVLAIIAAQGYNVTDLLGSEVGDSLELRAMKRMLDERLAPITRDEQARQQQAQAAERGKAEYDRFVASNDYAEIHANDIVQVMQREGVNAQTAYNRLYQFAATNRLDFSQPLGPQVTQRMTALKNNGNRQPQQQNGTQRKPMPNGASTRGSGAVPTMPLADANDDWGSIISEVQKTMGNA